MSASTQTTTAEDRLAEAVAEGIDPTIYGRRWLIVAAMCTSLLAVMLANTSLNLALPGLTTDLGITTTEQTWVVDLYSLLFAALLFTSGAMSDRYGRKLLLQVGLAIFAGSALYAAVWAQNGIELIIARGAMGLGAAFVMPSTLSIINATFPRGQRASAIAVWTGIAAAGAGLGSVLSGFLLEHYDWRSVFVMSVAFGLFAMVANQLLTSESSDEHQTPVDWLGGLLSTVGILGLVYAIIEGPTHGWLEQDVLAAIGVAIAGIGAFIWWERRAANPMLDLSLFKNPLFSVSSVSCLIAFFALTGSFYLLAQLFQLVLGYGTLDASLLTLPILAPMLVLSPFVPRILAKMGAKLTIGIGLLIIAAGFVLCSTWTSDSSYVDVLVPLLVVVVGMVFTMTPATNLIIAAVPTNRSGMGSAMNDTIRELGAALGIAVLGALISAGYTDGVKDVTKALPADLAEAAQGSLAAAVNGVGPAVQAGAGERAADAFVTSATDAWMSGLTTAMLVAAGLALAAAIWTFLAMPSKPREKEFVADPHAAGARPSAAAA